MYPPPPDTGRRGWQTPPPDSLPAEWPVGEERWWREHTSMALHLLPLPPYPFHLHSPCHSSVKLFWFFIYTNNCFSWLLFRFFYLMQLSQMNNSYLNQIIIIKNPIWYWHHTKFKFPDEDRNPIHVLSLLIFHFA